MTSTLPVAERRDVTEERLINALGAQETVDSDPTLVEMIDGAATVEIPPANDTRSNAAEASLFDRLHGQYMDAFVSKQMAEATFSAQKQAIGAIAENFEGSFTILQEKLEEIQNCLVNDKAISVLLEEVHTLATEKLGEVVTLLNNSLAQEGFVATSPQRPEEIRFDDISDLKSETEALREEIAILEKMSKEYDASMHDTIHDLKSSLGQAIQWSDVFRKGIIKADEAMIKVLVDQVSVGIGIIRKLKASDHGEIIFQPQLIPNLCQWIDDLLEASSLLSQEKEIRVEKNIGSEIALEVDPFCLTRVINNLLSNAIKFTPPKGKITIFAERNAAGNVVLGVKNTGAGIAPERLIELLDGQQRHKSTMGTAGEEGTGYGLGYCQRVAKSAGGRFWAESQVGEQVTFFMEFPQVINSQNTALEATE